MSEQFSLVLPERKLGQDLYDPIVGSELAKELENMPLAISQASSYIHWKSPQVSMSDYLSTLRKHDRKKAKLLKNSRGDARRDFEAENSVMRTWEISFEHIRGKRMTASHLLSLMSFFDPHWIPRSMLLPPMLCVDKSGKKSYIVDEEGKFPVDLCLSTNKGGGNASIQRDTRINEKPCAGHSDKSIESTSSSEDETTSGFSEDLTMLQNFSMISAEIGGAMFEMHGLVRLGIRTWLSNTAGLETWKQEFITRMHRRLTSADGAKVNPRIRRRLLAHANAMVSNPPKQSASLNCETALFFHPVRLRVYLGTMRRQPRF